MLRWLRSSATRLSFAVLALLLGLIAPAHAGPPQVASITEVQPTAPDVRPAPVVRVFLVAYRAHGPPSGAVFILTCVRGMGVSACPEYRGGWTDGVTGLQRFGARWYAPGQGRFVSEDPAKAGNAWYAYCGGDPVNRADPSGLDWEWVITDDGRRESWPTTGMVGGDTSDYSRPDEYYVKPTGEWRFVDGSDPATPRPTMSLDALMQKGYPAPPNGSSGLPTVTMDYFLANRRPGWGVSIDNGDFDLDYDRTPYLRRNGVYIAALEGLTDAWGGDDLTDEQAAQLFERIDNIAVRASLVRGKSTSTGEYLRSDFWRYGRELAVNQLNAQAVNAAWVQVNAVGVGESYNAILAETGARAVEGIFAFAQYARAARLSGNRQAVGMLEEHIKDLGWDPARKLFNYREAAAGLRIEKKLGDRFGLLRRSDKGGDFISSKTNEIIDQMAPGYGGANTAWNEVRRSIDKHLKKSVDIVLMETRGMTPAMIAKARAYVSSLSEIEQKRFMFMDWP